MICFQAESSGEQRVGASTGGGHLSSPFQMSGSSLKKVSVSTKPVQEIPNLVILKQGQLQNFRGPLQNDKVGPLFRKLEGISRQDRASPAWQAGCVGGRPGWHMVTASIPCPFRLLPGHCPVGTALSEKVSLGHFHSAVWTPRRQPCSLIKPLAFVFFILINMLTLF